MGRYIVKLGDLYVEWSTIVDAPITYGMTEHELRDFMRDQYGKRGLEDFDNRMERVLKKGTSSYNHESAEETVAYNRAGTDDSCLSFQELVEQVKAWRDDELAQIEDLDDDAPPGSDINNIGPDYPDRSE